MGAGRELKAPSNQLFVGEHMTMDGEVRLRGKPGKGRWGGRSVYRSMRLSQSLAGPCKHTQSRMPPAGGTAESAGSRRPLLPRQQEFRSRPARLGKGRHGEWPGMRAQVRCGGHRGAGTAASAVAARRRVAAVLSLLIGCNGLLGISLGPGNSGMRPRSHRVLDDALGLNHQPANLGLGHRCGRANHRRGNGSCRRHEDGEQNQQPKANEFHATGKN